MTARLDSDAALASGLAELRRLDPAIDRLVRSGIEPPLRRREPGFSGLVSLIVAQQVSTASAAAIGGRLAAVLGTVSPQAVAGMPDEALLGAGLSRPKLKTLRAVSRAAIDGTLPLDGLTALPAEEAHAALTAVHGIGPWTADIYLMFCLGHPDTFPAGDLALQEAARALLDLPHRPTGAALATIAADRWRPWRSVAALTLWAYYRRLTSRSGTPPA